METKLNCNGLWWTPGSQKIFGNLTFDDNEGAVLSIHGSLPQRTDILQMFPIYQIILGETEDGRLITLHNCNLVRSEPYLRDLHKSTIKIEVILIGHHFETEDSIQFEKVSVEFSSIDVLMKPLAKLHALREKRKAFGITVNDACVIEALTQSSVITHSPSRRTSLQIDTDILITSDVEKTFYRYRELWNIILDFFNFFAPGDVDLVSIKGFYVEHIARADGRVILGIVKILYQKPIMTGLNKPVNNVHFYLEAKYCLLIPIILKKWFELILSRRLESVINLYFAVMVSGSDLFLEFQFLAFAQALELWFRSLTNPKFIFLDEADMFRKGEQEDVRHVSERYIGKSDPYIVMVSTPAGPGSLFYQIEAEPEEICLYKRLKLDYTYGVGKIYTEEEIERAKHSPSFDREYRCQFSGFIGNLFSPLQVDKVIELGEQYSLAVELAKVFKAELVLLHVIEYGIEPLPTSLILDDKDLINRARRSARRQLEKGWDKMVEVKTHEIENDNVDLTGECRYGSAAEQILRFAKSNKIDTIVMGSRRLKGILKIKALGSVARKVSELADCSVLIVH